MRKCLLPAVVASLLAFSGVAFGHNKSSAKDNGDTSSSSSVCPEGLVSIPPEDPFTLQEMNEARRMAQAMQVGLKKWTYRVEPLNPAKVKASLAELKQAKVDVNSPAFRDLFLIVQRFVLAAKGSEGRLRPLAELLEAREGETRRLVNFFAQLDILAMRNTLDQGAPKFLGLSNSPKEFLAWELPTVPAQARAFLEGPVAHVLASRLRYTRLQINELGNQLIIKSPVGVYKVNLFNESVNRRSIAPLLVSATEAWGRQNDFVIHSLVDIFLHDEEASYFIRTMTRSDAFLHPHLIPPSLDVYPQPAQPSEIQLDARDRLLKLDKSLRTSAQAAGHTGPIRLGLTQPTGEGKTVTTAEYLKSLSEQIWDHKKPKVVVVVENVQILAQTAESLQRDLGLDPKKIALLFGETGEVTLGSGTGEFTVMRGAGLSAPSDFDLIVTTRSTFMERRSTFDFAIRKEQAQAGRPFTFVIDEAHHVGTDQGEFRQIQAFLKDRLTIKDRVLYLSATMWHPEMNIVRDDLKGAITGTHLMEDELRQLQSGENLEALARTQFLRSQIKGYIGPIEDQSATLYDGTEYGRTVRDRLRGPNVADEELYAYISKLIHGMRMSGIRDRFLFFEVRQDRAKDGAALLQRHLGSSLEPESDLHRTAWFTHSDIPVDEQNFRLRWFRDRGEFRGSRFSHKYLTTVGQFLEGVDIRGINGIVIMRNLSSYRLAQQVIGRGARLEPFKTGVRLIDVPGKIVAYLEEAGQLWDEANYLAPKDFAGWNREPDESLWGRGEKPPALLDRPDDNRLVEATSSGPAVLASRRIDMEPVLQRERKAESSWREIPAEEMADFTGPGGALELLGWNMEKGRRSTHVRLKSWFEQCFHLFSAEVQLRWQSQLTSLDFSDDEVEIATMSDEQRVQAAQGFHLLAKMFNGLSHTERYGIDSLYDSERLLTSGQARVLARLDPRFNFTRLGGVPMFDNSVLKLDDLNQEKIDELKNHFTEGLLLDGRKPSVFTNTFHNTGRRSPSELLVVLKALIALRPALKTPEALRILETAESVVFSQDQGELRKALATYYVGYLVNHYLDAANLTELSSWNLNGYFGLEAGKDYLVDKLVTRPTEADLWELLDLVEVHLAKTKP